MAQYQSFPDAAGDSLTLDKLTALRLPNLAGRSFLDVGCNEGFFCGFASHQGALRSVGIDHSAQFIERARSRFPRCEFLHQGWGELPDGTFDAVLLASALHYADDQPALLHRLMQKVAPDGMLILELGIVSSPSSAWIKVNREIDERVFPTMPMLRDVLRGYAWKWMGPSVSQPGDPVARHVIHVSHRRPFAYMLLQPPAYGKTTISNALFLPAHIRVVSGDDLMGRAVKGLIPIPDELRESLAHNYSPFALDLTIQRIFDEGLGEQLVALWVSEAGAGDFALDGYVPGAHHATVERLLGEAGYLPVMLNWNRIGLEYLTDRELASQAEAYYLSLANTEAGGDPEGVAKPRRVPTGFVDELNLAHGQLALRGWAIDENGNLPEAITIRLGEKMFRADVLQKQMRPDVQRHLQLSHGLVGYRIQIATPGVRDLSTLKGPVEIAAAGSDGTLGRGFQLSGELAQLLAERDDPAK